MGCYHLVRLQNCQLQLVQSNSQLITEKQKTKRNHHIQKTNFQFKVEKWNTNQQLLYQHIVLPNEQQFQLQDQQLQYEEYYTIGQSTTRSNLIKDEQYHK